MNNPKLLILRFEGPLQSWGLRARWDVRDTGSEPTKSGVVGLLGCALGYKRDDPRLENELSSNLKMGIREERQGQILVDFQTITGVIPRAAGTKKGKEETVVSPRSYIQDGSFLVILSGSSELLEKCRNALQNPHWPIYLGRKACPPTRPVFEELTEDYSSIRDALNRYSWIEEEKLPSTTMELRCILENPEGESIRQDNLSVNPARSYSNRQVEEFWVTIEGKR